MNRIIAIYGHHDCGKTSTLNYVCELIRNSGGVSLSNNPTYSGDDPATFDFNGQIVCVCPGGDTGEVVRKNFDYAYSKKADIIITASRCRGEGPAIVNQEAQKQGIEVKWFPKSYEYYLSSDTQDLCNKEYAGFVFRMI